MTIRVVLADDHPIFRDGLVRSLEESGRFTVARRRRHCRRGGCPRAEHIGRTSCCSTSRCRAAASRRRGASPPAPATPRIAMLTVSESEQDVAAALRAGAIGYVLKGVSAAELVEILAGVAAGRGACLADAGRRGSCTTSNGRRRATPGGRSTSSASARRTSSAGSRAA